MSGGLNLYNLKTEIAVKKTRKKQDIKKSNRASFQWSK